VRAQPPESPAAWRRQEHGDCCAGATHPRLRRRRRSFAASGVRDGDLISLLRARPAAPGAAPAQAAQGPAMPPRNADGSLTDPQAFIRGLLASPATLAAILPALADAARRGDVAALNGFFRRAGGPVRARAARPECRSRSEQPPSFGGRLAR